MLKYSVLDKVICKVEKVEVFVKSKIKFFIEKIVVINK